MTVDSQLPHFQSGKFVIHMHSQELIPHLFRKEFSKIVTVLCRHFGLEHIETAEDIASETFLAAFEIWTYKGVPANPTAWLYVVAKNKAKNHLTRNNLFNDKIRPELPNEDQGSTEINLSEQNITDSQLQMLFAICNPVISQEAQIGLALRILCGFGINEIADAFVTNIETISKRLSRAKEKLRREQVKIGFPEESEIGNRLENVLKTIYLLFSEGYYSESQDAVLRKDLCLEAMRLAYLLIENLPTSRPEVNALLSLMCFHSSRFEARKNDDGELILYEDQDETRWNHDLIAKGVYYFNQSSGGSTISPYHLEAGIAYWHTIKADTAEKWENILQLYNQLLQVRYSPVAALNRTYALARANGKITAIKEAEKLKLEDNQYYFALLGALYTGIDNLKAITHYEKSLSLIRTEPEKKSIKRKIEQLQTRIYIN